MKFLKQDDKWCLSYDDKKDDFIECDTLEYFLETNQKFDPNIVKEVVWDGIEFCFLFDDSDELFNIREFVYGTNGYKFLKIIQDICAGFLLSVKDVVEGGSKWMKEFLESREDVEDSPYSLMKCEKCSRSLKYEIDGEGKTIKREDGYHASCPKCKEEFVFNV